MDPSPSLGIMRIQGRVQIFARERKGYGGTNNRTEQPKLFLCSSSSSSSPILVVYPRGERAAR